uniref:Secreted protein n=1 Tax=Auxenochlorella protothecoides TaxID=3075 RepID=A0A1D2A271_AUXPR
MYDVLVSIALLVATVPVARDSRCDVCTPRTARTARSKYVLRTFRHLPMRAAGWLNSHENYTPLIGNYQALLQVRIPAEPWPSACRAIATPRLRREPQPTPLRHGEGDPPVPAPAGVPGLPRTRHAVQHHGRGPGVGVHEGGPGAARPHPHQHRDQRDQQAQDPRTGGIRGPGQAGGRGGGGAGHAPPHRLCRQPAGPVGPLPRRPGAGRAGGPGPPPPPPGPCRQPHRRPGPGLWRGGAGHARGAGRFAAAVCGRHRARGLRHGHRAARPGAPCPRSLRPASAPGPAGRRGSGRSQRPGPGQPRRGRRAAVRHRPHRHLRLGRAAARPAL